MSPRKGIFEHLATVFKQDPVVLTHAVQHEIEQGMTFTMGILGMKHLPAQFGSLPGFERSTDDLGEQGRLAATPTAVYHKGLCD